MNVKSIETGKVYNLSIIDPKNGVDYIADLIGNNGGFSDNPQDGIYYNDGREEYLSTTENIIWWEQVIDDLEAVEKMVKDAADKLGIDASDLELQIAHAFDVDLDAVKDRVEDALTEILEDV